MIDVEAAVRAHTSALPPEVLASSEAYTRGGYLVMLAGFAVSVLIAWLIIRSGVLVALRDNIQAQKPWPLLVSLAVIPVYFVLATLLSLPWDAYPGWWREVRFGLSNLSFAAWLSEGLVRQMVGVIGGTIFFTVIYFVIRRAPKLWWAFGAGVSALFILLTVMIAPVVIEPMFNTYREAEPGPVREAVLELARENGVPTDKVYVYDGSRQSDRYTANVSGLGGTARIAMSDAMLRKATLEEVRAVVGHEIGHYKRMHIPLLALGLSVIFAGGFYLAHRLFPTAQRLLGAGRVHGVADPAGLPVLLVVLGVLSLLATPLFNSLNRLMEEDADRYSLVHVNEPDGLASALVKTAEYRYPSPTPLEEFVFYSHPSVENRVRRAMAWKAAQAGGGGGDAPAEPGA